MIDLIKSSYKRDSLNFNKDNIDDLFLDFILYYHYCITIFISLENNLDYDNVYINICKDINKLSLSNKTKFFIYWLKSININDFNLLLICENKEEIKNDFVLFMKLYNHILDKCILDKNIDSLIDYLYYIPYALTNIKKK